MEFRKWERVNKYKCKIQLPLGEKTFNLLGEQWRHLAHRLHIFHLITRDVESGGQVPKEAPDRPRGVPFPNVAGGHGDVHEVRLIQTYDNKRGFKSCRDKNTLMEMAQPPPTSKNSQGKHECVIYYIYMLTQTCLCADLWWIVSFEQWSKYPHSSN